VSAPAAFDAFLRAAPSLSSLYDQVARAALSEAPILVLGPPGSGRSTLARAVHEASERRDAGLSLQQGRIGPRRSLVDDRRESDELVWRGRRSRRGREW
jgi:hypothetical protein